ncbi:hypothetical protein LMB83_08640 [Limosilactobacillus reuteri]|uniref:hypothetical protein n=1 Tax=Limosilactobacillus reuteri TaxID=1598 RepID=UPI001E4FF8D2|nr:hypothetical protein [Limosilactobacillus reuteri]MCC4412101.1 hypothetical protein [Limosilactobacillus reuteri]
MEKDDGVLDDLIEGNNRLDSAAQLEAGDSGDIFFWDLIYTLTNAIMIFWLCDKSTTSIYVICTTVLLILNIFPRVLIKTSMYNQLIHNSESLLLKVLGYVVKILMYISGILLIVAFFLLKEENYFRVLFLISIVSTTVLGVFDKYVSFLLKKAIKKRGDEK